MTDHPPSSLANGRFQVVRRLGAGAMGSVWLARDSHLGGRLVAVKVLTAYSSSGAPLSRFRREAKIMAKLRHPGLIDVYDVSLEGPERYIAQEYVEGADLASILARSGPLPTAAVRRLAGELAETLAYLHGQGVVHRDLKPANIMMQSDGRSRVADLGLAVADDCTRMTQEGSLLGTVLYMAPEAVRGEATGPAADVFAAGIILWQAATGHHPFWTTASPQEHLLRVAAEELETPPRPQDMALELYQLLTACMQPAVHDRPADGSAMMSMTKSSPSSLSSPSSSSLPSPPSPRRRRPLLVAFTVTLSLALVLVLSVGGRPEAAPAEVPDGLTLSPPTVGCLLDGVELTLPHPPPPGTTARLLTTDGEILVQRSMRSSRVVLRPPADFKGPLRWAIHGGGTTLEGPAASGPRLLFDAVTLLPELDQKGVAVAVEPLFLGNRVALAVTPTTVLVLERRSLPGGLPTLELAVSHTVAVRPRPRRLEPVGWVGRIRGSLAALAPLGPDHVGALPFGLPAATVGLPLVPDVPPAETTRPGLDLVDALVLPGLDGGCVVVLHTLPRAGFDGREEVLVAFYDGNGISRAPELALPGRTPLAAAFLDPDRLLLAYVDGPRVVVAILRREGLATGVVTSRTLDVAPPTWREDSGPVGRSLSGGRAALAVGSRLVVARSDGSLLVRPLDPGRLGGVGGLVEDGPNALVVIMNRLTSPLATGGSIDVQRVPLENEDAPVPAPVRLRQTSERIDEVLPLGVLPTGEGGFLLYSTGLLVDCEGPPHYRWRSSVRVDGLAGWMSVHEGTVYITTTKGRVYAFDLPGR